MSNLKIKDIETLETLSFDEMEQVVGGSVCPFATASTAIDDEPIIIIDDPVVPKGVGEVDGQIAVEGEMLFSLIDLVNI